MTDASAPGGQPGEAPWMAQARRVVARAVVRALRRCDELGIDWQDFSDAMLAEEKVAPPPRGMEDTLRRAFARLGADPGDCLRPPWAPPRPGDSPPGHRDVHHD